MTGLMEVLTSERGLSFDKYLVRYTGYSLLNLIFARQNNISSQPALLLRTVGCKSGVWREAVLPYFPLRGELIVVGSRGGMAQDPLWVNNLRVNSSAEIFLDRRLRIINSRKLSGEEHTAAWQEVTNKVPTYREYQARCQEHRQIPLLALSYN